MGCKDLHIKPFDKGTIVKLEIFEDYAQAWIPTFVMQPNIPEIHIFDFFAGSGYDCNNFISNHPKFKCFLTINYYNEDAEKLFFKLLNYINTYPSLIYLDQNGVRFISQEFIRELEKLKTTDFLYFVSSSYFKRFFSTSEFRKILDFKTEELEKVPYNCIHRLVLNKMEEGLSPKSKFKLDFEKLVLNGKLCDNKSALLFTYSRGHIPKHATDVIKRLKQENKIHYEGRTPAMNYDNVFRRNKKEKHGK